MSTDWTPGETVDTECQNCGGHVTKNFVRVFSQESGVVDKCPNCSTGSEIRGGPMQL